eukprot:TRINITY_DN4681_c0_g1_i1.p2 TRINITY_DN4681_c0_g1~~TRINITY_DN4681_c0_g1_i1.p2  ORF type:complete len:443 (+),score=153.52 TRINITY_DN4681_c0_g1_i1:155-1483(+)
MSTQFAFEQAQPSPWGSGSFNTSFNSSASSSPPATAPLFISSPTSMPLSALAAGAYDNGQPKLVSPALQYLSTDNQEPAPEKEKEEGSNEGQLFTQKVKGVSVVTGQTEGLPTPRFGHTAVVHENDMIIFGGRDASCNDDVWVYNFPTKVWKKVPITGEKPKARAGHTAVIIRGHYMYMFGGVAEQTSNGSHSCWLNDLWSLNLKTFHWTMLRSKGGHVPGKRKGHTAVTHRESMFVFGGGQDDLTLYNDLWEYNHVTHKWIPRKYTGYSPQERMYHVASTSGSRMIVFGGRALTKQGFLNDTFELNLNSFVCRQLQTKGTPPTHRMCSTAACHNGLFAVFTGGSLSYLVDSYQLDLRKMEWSLIENVSFGGRTRPSTVRWNNTILTFGGCVEGNGYVNDYFEVELHPRSLKHTIKQFILDKKLEFEPEDLPASIQTFIEES